MELQLCSDLFFLLGRLDRIQYQVAILVRGGLVDNDAVVIEISDDG